MQRAARSAHYSEGFGPTRFRTSSAVIGERF
jgi:hypothetical protein